LSSTNTFLVVFQPLTTQASSSRMILEIFYQMHMGLKIRILSKPR